MLRPLLHLLVTNSSDPGEIYALEGTISAIPPLNSSKFCVRGKPFSNHAGSKADTAPDGNVFHTERNKRFPLYFPLLDPRPVSLISKLICAGGDYMKIVTLRKIGTTHMLMGYLELDQAVSVTGLSTTCTNC